MEHPTRCQVAVIGAGTCDEELARLARRTGRLLAAAGAVVLTGGRGGVMEAASRGAREAGGLTVGILPGADAHASPPNDAVEVAVFSGMGQARNQLLVLSARALIAVGGSWGTLSEIALAVKQAKPVALLRSWHLERPDSEPEPLLRPVTTPEEAVEVALGTGAGSHSE